MTCDLRTVYRDPAGWTEREGWLGLRQLPPKLPDCQCAISDDLYCYPSLYVAEIVWLEILQNIPATLGIVAIKSFTMNKLTKKAP